MKIPNNSKSNMIRIDRLPQSNFHIGSQIKMLTIIAVVNVINWDILTLTDSYNLRYGLTIVHNICFSLNFILSIQHYSYFIRLEEREKNLDKDKTIATVDATKSIAMFDQATVQMTRFNRGDATPTIYEIISDPELRDAFAKHLEREFAIENLLFIQDIVRYKSASKETASAISKRLLDDFMLPNSLHEVNLPGPLVKATVKSIETLGNRVETFDEALHHILFMLETDQLPKFLKSQIYRNYCNQ